MNETMNNILLCLVDQARENKDHEASYDLVSIVANSEQVRNFTNQLERSGFITSVSVFGKTYFSCQVTEKAFEYFKGEEKK